MQHEALKSLYGGKSALAGHVGGLARKQEVYTPPWIIDATRRTFDGPIDLDPCAASDPSEHFATANITLPDDGLAVDWWRDIYVNPPFKDLQQWLAKCHAQSQRGARIVALFPFRPHRRWFFSSLKICELVFLHYDVKFVGHKTAFPAPLVLASWNCLIPSLGSRETKRITL